MHRVLIISHTYIPPSNRGKLRALAARGLEVTVGVPQRWRDLVLGRTLEIAWERQNGVEVFPLPARHSGDAATLTFRGRALHALLRDKRPDLVQVEEEPTAPAARQVVRAARQPFGPGEGNRYFVAGAGREPRASLAPDGGGRRPRPGAAGAAGVRPAPRGSRPLDRRPAARGSAEAVARAGRAGAAGARAADVGRTGGARSGGGDGARGDGSGHERRRDAGGDRRRGGRGAGGRPAGALGGAAPSRRRRPTPPPRAGGTGEGDAAVFG